MKHLKILRLVFVTWLTGCATPNVPATYSPDTKSNKGIVVASITYKGVYSSYRIFYREVNGKTEGLLEFGAGLSPIPIRAKSDFGKAATGKLIVAELPAGEYEVYNWAVFNGNVRVTAANQFSIRFKVEPGKAVYLGNFAFQTTRSFGLSISGADLSLKGEQERDLAVLKEKFPNMANTPVVFSMPTDTSLEHIGDGDQQSIFIPIFIPR